MKKLMILLMIVFTASALAHNNGHHRDGERYRDTHHYDKGHHVKKHARYAKVVRSKPIYKEVVTYCDCRTNPHGHHSGGHHHDGALIGGLIGGIIGHNMNIRHNGPATIGGAVAGAIIGSKLSHHRERPAHCEHVETQLVGYKNIAYWRGEKIVRISDKPLRRIRIKPEYPRHH